MKIFILTVAAIVLILEFTKIWTEQDIAFYSLLIIFWILDAKDDIIQEIRNNNLK